jgi:hypothetical protein
MVCSTATACRSLVAAIDGLQAAGDTSLFEAAQTAVFALKWIG